MGGGAEYWKARNAKVASGTYTGSITIGGVKGTIADFQAASARTGVVYRYGSSQITPTGIKPKHALAGQPRGWAVTYYDQITPGVQMLEIGMDAGIIMSSDEANAAIADEIQKIYDAGGEPTWQPAGPSWLEFKSKKGYDMRTMHMTGALEANVHKLRNTLHTHYDDKTGMFTLGGFETAFAGTEYVWAHELVGAPWSGVRRPFIYQGIQRGLQAAEMVSTMIHQTTESLAMEVPPIRISVAPPEPLGMAYARHRTRLRLGFLSLLMWVIPPSKVWALFGAATDLLAAGTGKMFESHFLSQWITAYLKGMLAAKAGAIATEKQARRAFRGRLWRGR
jgi:hypothetical protein